MQGAPEGRPLVQPARSHEAPSTPMRMPQVRTGVPARMCRACAARQCTALQRRQLLRCTFLTTLSQGGTGQGASRSG